jgi:AraC family transcriptional regulator
MSQAVQHAETTPRYTVGDGTFRAIAELVAVLQDGLDTDWSVDSMAAKAGYDVFHFAHAFREVIGVAPAQYLRTLRLERAVHDLFHEDKSLPTIAGQAGYASVEAFRRAFTRAFGKAPLAYRKAGLAWNSPRTQGVTVAQPPDARALADVPPEILDGPVLEEIGPLRGVAVRAGEGDAGIAEAYFRLVMRMGPCGPWERGTVTPPQGWASASGLREFSCVQWTANPPAQLRPHLEPWRLRRTLFARFTFDGKNERIRPAIDWLFARWLPASGFRRSFEASLTSFDESDWPARCMLSTRARVYVPITPLRVA